MQKFLKYVKFCSGHKIRDAELILDIFSSHKNISREDVLKFVELKGSTTVRNVIERFHIPKMNAYTTLNKLTRENKLIKIESYPNNYIYPAGILR